MKYDSLIRPILFRLSPETAHEIGIGALRIFLSSKASQDLAAKRFDVGSFEPLTRFGLQFKSPLGMAAGFDKNGIVVNQLAALGFGFVEVGTVTLKPQKGNEKPRMFRLPEDHALINRLGFNNEGASVVVERLSHLERRCIVGVNIGKNKDVPNDEAVQNYLSVFDLVHPVADYITINISSPNTPNLRELQHGENLEELVGRLVERNKVLSSVSSTAFRRPSRARTPLEGGTQNSTQNSTQNKPILVKIAPDLSEADIEMIVDTCLRYEVAGIIATNTTVSRDGLKTAGVEKFGAGGVSGRPLAKRSNEVISTIYRYSKGKLPIVGVGGIFTAEDAFDKIAAGAWLLQAYTGFVYGGPSFASEINRGLTQLLTDRGFSTIDAAIGCRT